MAEATTSGVAYVRYALSGRNRFVSGIAALAAAGVGGFNQIAGHVASKAPLRRNISQDEVAGAAVYLSSRLARGVTGEIHFVDSGYNIIGL